VRIIYARGNAGVLNLKRFCGLFFTRFLGQSQKSDFFFKIGFIFEKSDFFFKSDLFLRNPMPKKSDESQKIGFRFAKEIRFCCLLT